MVQVEFGIEMEEQLTREAAAQGVSLIEHLRRKLESVRIPLENPGQVELAKRRAAVESMKGFASEYGFTVGPDLTIRDMINEGRR